MLYDNAYNTWIINTYKFVKALEYSCLLRKHNMIITHWHNLYLYDNYELYQYGILYWNIIPWTRACYPHAKDYILAIDQMYIL